MRPVTTEITSSHQCGSDGVCISDARPVPWHRQPADRVRPAFSSGPTTTTRGMSSPPHDRRSAAATVECHANLLSHAIEGVPQSVANRRFRVGTPVVARSTRFGPKNHLPRFGVDASDPGLHGWGNSRFLPTRCAEVISTFHVHTIVAALSRCYSGGSRGFALVALDASSSPLGSPCELQASVVRILAMTLLLVIAFLVPTERAVTSC